MGRLVCYMLLGFALGNLFGCQCSGSSSAKGEYRSIDRATGKVRTVVIRKDDGINYEGSVGSYFVAGSWGVTMASNDATWTLCKGAKCINYEFLARTQGSLTDLKGTALAKQ